MQILNIAFETTDWSQIAPTEHKGKKGKAFWRTKNFGDIRVRMVEYTAGYLADHWCAKGHIIFCIEEACTNIQRLLHKLLVLYISNEYLCNAIYYNTIFSNFI